MEHFDVEVEKKGQRDKKVEQLSFVKLSFLTNYHGYLVRVWWWLSMPHGSVTAEIQIILFPEHLYKCLDCTKAAVGPSQTQAEHMMISHRRV